jgi:uncharacterized membrane protein YeaQ/YmgE (transglycosylase-associated protein family)
MTDDTIRIEFEVTLDELVEVYAPLVLTSQIYRRGRLRSLILIGALAGAVGVCFTAGLLRRPAGVEVLVGAVGGALALSLCGRLYDHGVTQRIRALFTELWGAKMPTRCAIELRPDYLWHCQDGAETTYAWTTVTAVEDKPDEVEISLERGGVILAKNRAFATASDRERFVERARALAQAAQRTTTTV